MAKKIIYPLLMILMVMLSVVSCSDMNDIHEPYQDGGEEIYIGKALTPTYYPGNNRVKLTWAINADPKITKARVEWTDTQARSVEFPVEPGPGIVEKLIENVPEGGYNFDIFMLGDNGERSVKVQLIANVYGEKYQNSISNPLAKVIAYKQFNNPTNSLDLEWLGVSDQVMFVEIKYTIGDGTEATVIVTRPVIAGKAGVFPERTILPDYKPGTDLSYRSGYMPNISAIDIFYTGYKIVTSASVVQTRMIRPGTYKIIAKHSGKALRVRHNADGSPNNNANAQLEQNVFDDANLLPTIKWRLKYNVNGYATFTSVSSVLDIGVASGGTPSLPLLTDGANIVQVAQGDLTHEEWTIESVEATGKYFKITNRNSGKVIEIQSGGLTNGAAAQQRTYSAAAEHQKFEFVEVQ